MTIDIEKDDLATQEMLKMMGAADEDLTNENPTADELAGELLATDDLLSALDDLEENEIQEDVQEKPEPVLETEMTTEADFGDFTNENDDALEDLSALDEVDQLEMATEEDQENDSLLNEFADEELDEIEISDKDLDSMMDALDHKSEKSEESEAPAVEEAESPAESEMDFEAIDEASEIIESSPAEVPADENDEEIILPETAEADMSMDESIDEPLDKLSPSLDDEDSGNDEQEIEDTLDQIEETGLPEIEDLEIDELSALPDLVDTDELDKETLAAMTESESAPTAEEVEEAEKTVSNDSIEQANDAISAMDQAVSLDKEIAQIATTVSNTAKEATQLAISVTQKAQAAAEKTQNAIEATLAATERAFNIAKEAGYELDLAQLDSSVSNEVLAKQIQAIHQKNQQLSNTNRLLKEKVDALGK